MTVYGRWGSLRQKPSPLAEALLAHPNVSVTRHEKRFDHAKLYVFDDETVILGGMGIGDDFRHHNVDFMVEISGGEAAAGSPIATKGARRSIPSGRSTTCCTRSRRAGAQEGAARRAGQAAPGADRQRAASG